MQIVLSWSADHFNARALHSALSLVVGGIGFLASALLPATSYGARYACLFIASAGAFSSIPPLLGWLSANIAGTAAVGLALALNIGLAGAPGQIIGVWVYKDGEAASGYPTGHGVNAAFCFLGAAGCVALRVYYGWRNRGLVRSAGGDGDGDGDEVRLFRY